MKNAIVFIVILLVLILIGGLFLDLTRNETAESTAVAPNDTPIYSDTSLYFWSVTCPHCKNVADFIDSWEGKDKFKLVKYEVNETRENANLFLKTGTEFCDIPKNNLGVPLLVTPEGECLIGDTQIIEYLQNLEL